MSGCSPLLTRYRAQLESAGRLGPVLDLACGGGRNGLHLIEKDISVVFADISSDALDKVQAELDTPALRDKQHLATLWQVDFEQEGASILPKEQFAAILLFRYLHRPLMPQIKDAIMPGGMVVYETFTTDQPRYGRPTNADFLLAHGELSAYFVDWQIQHDFEGLIKTGAKDHPSAMAQLIARKPGVHL